MEKIKTTRRQMVLGALGIGAGAALLRSAPVSAAHEDALRAFVPLQERLLDTRDGTGTDEAIPVFPGQLVPIVTPFVNNVPPYINTSFARAVHINVKLIGAKGEGYVTVWDGNAPRPNVSLIDANGLSIINNSTIALLDRFGFFSIFVYGITTHMVVDLIGYYGNPPEFATGIPPVPR